MTQFIISDGKKEERREFPEISDCIPYLKEKTINIVDENIYFSKQTSCVVMGITTTGAPYASGGRILIDDNGNEFSQDLYVRLCDSGHDNTKTHLNVSFFTEDKRNSMKFESKIDNFHRIEFENKTKCIDIKIKKEDEEEVKGQFILNPKDFTELLRYPEESLERIKKMKEKNTE